MTHDTRTLIVTVGDPDDTYADGREAVERLAEGDAVDEPATVRFATSDQLTAVFDAETYELLRTIRSERPATTAALAARLDRTERAVARSLDTLASLGVVRLRETDDGRRPVFPYDDLVVRPLASGDDHAETTAAP
ncbi:winged helix DNA-binding protein [Halobaculum sp. MBLA0147]|uniref:HVO_A0114 family putative DNA-binding protein n=1 Tax=Halobaculum sp. MBLA0147 TaxID=3079934 RepID=UPI00352689E9